VVISIIAILAMLIMPGVNYAQELARRTKCKSNAKNIAEACAIYMNTPRWHRKSNAGPGIPREFDPEVTTSNWASGVSGNPASLWLLVKYNLIGRDAFLCPSAEINRDFRAPTANADEFSSNTLSYSYLSQVEFTDNTSEAVANGNTNVVITSSMNPGLKASELAIVADSNPRSRVGRQSLSSEENGRNSRNHNRAGQNVAFLGGNADWFSTTTIPGTNPLFNGAPDDIYRSDGGSDAQGKRGAINDAFLIP